MRKHPYNFIDISGQRFGRVTAICPDELFPGYWYCRCDCGVKFYAASYDLRRGRTRSCGCLRSELTRQLGYRYGGHAHRDIPIRVVFRDGSVEDYPNIKTTAAAFRVTRSTIRKYARLATEYKGHKFQIITK